MAINKNLKNIYQNGFGKNTILVGVKGTSASALFESVDVFIKSKPDAEVVWVQSVDEFFEKAATTTATGDPLLVVGFGLLDELTDSYIPKLSRLNKKTTPQNYFIVTGKDFKSDEVLALFRKPRSAAFDVTYIFSAGHTRNRLIDLVEYYLSTTPKQAEYIVDVCNESIEELVQLFRKVKAFDFVLSFDQIKAIASKDIETRFITSLTGLKYKQAFEQLDATPKIRAAFFFQNINRNLARMSVIYPHTKRVKIPGKNQIIETKLTYNTLVDYWPAAGRYSPKDMLRRQLLTVELFDFITGTRPGDLQVKAAYARMLLKW